MNASASVHQTHSSSNRSSNKLTDRISGILRFSGLRQFQPVHSENKVQLQ